MIFRRFKAEYSDGVIDLIPMHIDPPNPELRFGHEQIWRITLHNSRKEIGQISYRDGESRCVYYYGHIGYHIDPPYRGRHFAYRACLLIRSEIRMSGKSSVVITCDPDNPASRRTCERLRCMLEGEVAVPEDLQQKYELSAVKCRYIWHITEQREQDDHRN